MQHLAQAPDSKPAQVKNFPQNHSEQKKLYSQESNRTAIYKLKELNPTKSLDLWSPGRCRSPRSGAHTKHGRRRCLRLPGVTTADRSALRGVSSGGGITRSRRARNRRRPARQTLLRLLLKHRPQYQLHRAIKASTASQETRKGKNNDNKDYKYLRPLLLR